MPQTKPISWLKIMLTMCLLTMFTMLKMYNSINMKKNKKNPFLYHKIMMKW